MVDSCDWQAIKHWFDLISFTICHRNFQFDRTSSAPLPATASSWQFAKSRRSNRSGSFRSKDLNDWHCNPAPTVTGDDRLEEKQVGLWHGWFVFQLDTDSIVSNTAVNVVYFFLLSPLIVSWRQFYKGTVTSLFRYLLKFTDLGWQGVSLPGCIHHRSGCSWALITVSKESRIMKKHLLTRERVNNKSYQEK